MKTIKWKESNQESGSMGYGLQQHFKREMGSAESVQLVSIKSWEKSVAEAMPFWSSKADLADRSLAPDPNHLQTPNDFIFLGTGSSLLQGCED